MRARKLVVGLSLTVVLLAGPAGSAAAQPGRGCADFGAQGNVLKPDLGQLVSGLATGEPRLVADTVAAEHDALCD